MEGVCGVALSLQMYIISVIQYGVAYTQDINRLNTNTALILQMFPRACHGFHHYYCISGLYLTGFIHFFTNDFQWLLNDLYLIFHDQRNDSFSAVPLKMVYFNMEQEHKVCIWNMLCLSKTNPIGLLASTKISHRQKYLVS